jgi:hypothetical protein
LLTVGRFVDQSLTLDNKQDVNSIEDGERICD